MSPVSGKPPAITCTETHGWNSGIRATDLAGGDARGGTLGDAVGADPRARRPRLAGPSARPARRRAPDGRGRLSGAAQLFDRLGLGRGPEGRADDSAARRR